MFSPEFITPHGNPAHRLVRTCLAGLRARHEARLRCRPPRHHRRPDALQRTPEPALARYCGALFSLGHGVVVLAIALAVSTLAQSWQVPEWMDVLGAWISIAFLAALGLINLHAVLSAAPGEVVQPLGLKGRLFPPAAHHEAATGGRGRCAVRLFVRHHEPGRAVRADLAAVRRLGTRADAGAAVHARHACQRRTQRPLDLASHPPAPTKWHRSRRASWAWSSPASACWSPPSAPPNSSRRQSMPGATARELAFGLILVAIIAASYLFAVRGVRRPQLAT